LEDKTEKLRDRLKVLEPLVEQLKSLSDEAQRAQFLQQHPDVQHIAKLNNIHFLQSDVITPAVCLAGGEHLIPMLDTPKLKMVDQFYSPIGGLLGYYCSILKLLLGGKEPEHTPLALSRAHGFDLASTLALEEGLRAVPYTGEIYPVGGLATRLGYCDAQGVPLPAALLPFCGVSLLEGLIRDVEGREALYYHVFGHKVWIPLALMTSDENEEAVKKLLEEKNWFGRPKEYFFLFRQPSVPVITEEGEWVLTSSSSLAFQPGGHGALWQTAQQAGVFDWFRKHHRQHLLIRQINNPLAGLDHALLSFVGLGSRENKTFGFICCEREPEAAEGVVVLVEEMGTYRISNIEYMQVKAYGIEEATYLPANTNILYANLDLIDAVVQKYPLPECVLNMKHEIETMYGEVPRKVMGGRLESMMQGISNHLKANDQHQLPTFLAYQRRSRTISTAKRKFTGTLLETPEGAFYDLMRNAHDLLKECGFSLPIFYSKERYIQEGAPFVFRYHPRLGPLYSVIKQKLRGGCLAQHAELCIDFEDIFIEALDLTGSLLIQGQGKCVLKQVTLRNKGIGEQHFLCTGQYVQEEAVTITVHETAELHIEGVELIGLHTFEVPPGERWVLTSKGLVKKSLERPTWKWRYVMTENKGITCHLESCFTTC